MIRILKGNHRKAYFVKIAEILDDGTNKLCEQANDNCYSCQYKDVCDSLSSAWSYCRKIALQMKH